MPRHTWNKICSGTSLETVISCHTNRVLCTRLQVQRSKHRRALAFSATGRKFKPPVSRAVVDFPFGFEHGGEMKNPTGIDLLLKECRRRFRIPENLNHYSEEDFREAEKKFIKLCFVGGNRQDQGKQRNPLK
jgi:hypothetical protein